ncbi:MAG: site-2 protease family protein [Candidatus Micrarchaeia archaeon]
MRYAWMLEFIVVFIIFLVILSLPLADFHKFIAEVLLLGLYGYYLHNKYGLEHYYGMIMLRTREGLHKIDDIAKYSKFWKYFADTGIVLAYGLLSIFIYKHVSRRSLITGIIVLFFSAIFVLPNLYPIALSVISFPYEGIPTRPGIPSEGLDLVMLLIVGSLVLFGFAFITTISLIYQAASILISLFSNIFFQAQHDVQPGASLLLPGINLPFFEGVIALLILLFVHEMSHAILARVARVRLKSAGMLLFGFIPVGAFVDPDEEVLKKKAYYEQGRVLVAGSTANYFVSFVSFVLLIILISLPLDIYTDGLYVTAAREGLPIQKGDVIYSINGTNFSMLDEFIEYRKSIPPNTTLHIVTHRGGFDVQTDADGRIGILLTQNIDPSYNWYIFLKNLLALMFSLNFFVGSVNLLPIPLFDGHRLLEEGLGRRFSHIVNLISLITTASLITNLLPWLF